MIVSLLVSIEYNATAILSLADIDTPGSTGAVAGYGPKCKHLLWHSNDALDAAGGWVLPLHKILLKVGKRAPMGDPRINVDLPLLDEFNRARKIGSQCIAGAEKRHLP